MSTEAPTLDLKKTINLPKTKFGQKANLPQTEPARLKKWAEMDLYQQIRRARAGADKFILHDGPPYANADIHLGTALNKILKDFIVKSRTMMGFDAPYVPGYDCHGLPIELHVERKLGAKKATMPTLSIRRVCREFAADALKRQTRDFQRLGILGEWDNPYITMSDHYEAETARLFARFVERGFVYKGARPVYWCIHDQTALAEAEVEYNQHTSPSVYVKFPLASDPAQVDPALAGRKVFALIWTTTPWTLPGNVALAVDADIDYVKVRQGEEHLILAEARLGVLDGDYEVIERIKGRQLEGLDYEPLYTYLPPEGRAWYVVTADFVSIEEGTGVVHTAAAYGADDLRLCQEKGIPIRHTVDLRGRFLPAVEKFAGLPVKEADPLIIEDLRERGLLYKSGQIRHTYPFC